MSNHKKILLSLPSLFKWLRIACLLLLFWFVAGFLFTSFGSYFVLTDTYTNTFQSLQSSRLYKGQQLNGQFQASENNLGIVGLRVLPGNNAHSEQDDHLLFQIKEKGTTKWHYQNTYKGGFFRGYTYYPFGFPIISNSKGKIYQFRLTSLGGNKLNAITVVEKNPEMNASYQFSKSDLLHGRENILHFANKKLKDYFTDQQKQTVASIFFLPFIVFVLWTLFVKYSLLQRRFFLIVVVFIIFYQLILFSTMIYAVIFSSLLLWMIAVYRNKLASDFTFVLCFIIFFVGQFFIFFKNNSGELESSFLIYFLLVIGICQMIWEMGKQPKDLLTAKDVFENYKKKRLKKNKI